METALLAENIFGEKLYQQRARQAFPYLVRQAIMGETIYYSDLAKELGIPNERNLNYVLGSIGTTLVELAEQKKESIPPIQCLVINKATGLPGDGFGEFISESDFSSLDNKQKRTVVNSLLSNIYAFPRWFSILHELGLSLPNYPILMANPINRSAGESDAHRLLKEYVAEHPVVVGLPRTCPSGELEFCLPSGDSVDVMFQWRAEYVAVEIKSVISDVSDIQRGLYQCVKYRAVLEAMLGVLGKPKNVRALLVLGGRFPTSLLSTKNMLNIDVIENVQVGE